MKLRLPLLTTLAVAALGVAAAPRTAEADDRRGGFRFSAGFGRHGAHFRAGYRSRGRRHHSVRHRRYHGRYYPRHHRHRHHRPHYRRVWVPPVYRTVVVGYDDCGYPIYSKVVVRGGYYRKVRYRY